MKLDYTIEDPKDRVTLVTQLLEENPDTYSLESLADYILFAVKKEDRKKEIITQNRALTQKKREVYYEDLTQNGEDNIYNLIRNDKNILFQPKNKISKKDYEDIPELKQLHDEILIWEAKLKETKGRDAYVIKQMLIDLHKDQYLIRAAYKNKVNTGMTTNPHPPIYFEDKTHSFDEKGFPIIEGCSLMDPKFIFAILSNYSELYEESFDDFESDTKFLIFALDELTDEALKDQPIYLQLLEDKIDGLSGVQIQDSLQQKFGVNYSQEYISQIWHKKIPNLIASAAIDQYLKQNWVGRSKKCSRCGQIKLIHPKYFSRNSASGDNFYSICKECRNKGVKKKNG